MIPDSHKGRTAGDAASAPTTKPVLAGCDCVAQFDEQLKPKNLEVDSSHPMRHVMLPDGNRTVDILSARPRVMTCYIEKPKRGSGPAPSIEIKFCPFCGTPYDQKETPSQ